MKMLFIAASGAAAILLGSCASISRGTSEQVQFDSEPSGAEMRSVVEYPCGGPCPEHDSRPEVGAAYATSDVRTPPIEGPACITPCAAQVARNQELIVTFTKSGFEPQTVKLSNKMAGGGAVGVAGNALIGGAVGVVIDTGTGAALDHYPNPLKVVLRPIQQLPKTKR